MKNDKNQTSQREASPTVHCSPIFHQEFLGEFTQPSIKAKVGDIVKDNFKCVLSEIIVAYERQDGKIYATLKNGKNCVVPSKRYNLL